MCLTWLLMDGLVDFPVCPLPYQTLYLPCWWGVREIREFDHFAVLVKDGQHCPTHCYTSARSGKVCRYSWVMVLLITLSWLLATLSKKKWSIFHLFTISHPFFSDFPFINHLFSFFLESTFSNHLLKPFISHSYRKMF